jgi:hypothetical protein
MEATGVFQRCARFNLEHTAFFSVVRDSKKNRAGEITAPAREQGEKIDDSNETTH